MSSWLTAVLAALGVLAVVALAIGLILSRDNDNTPVTPAKIPMPNLVGQTESDAKAQLTQAKLTSVSRGADIETDDCAKTPTVAQQSPKPNTQIGPAEPITYQMCKSPSQVRVPGDLNGSTKDTANAALTRLNLEPVFKSVNSAAPVNTVVAVEHAGEQVDPGTKIEVSISKGNQVEIPNVVGKSEDEARAQLTALGLNVSTEQGDPSPNPGRVTEQNPSAGKILGKGKVVTLTISQPEDPNPGNSGTPSPGGTPPGGNGGGLGPVGGILN